MTPWEGRGNFKVGRKEGHRKAHPDSVKMTKPDRRRWQWRWLMIPLLKGSTSTPRETLVEEEEEAAPHIWNILACICHFVCSEMVASQGQRLYESFCVFFCRLTPNASFSVKSSKDGVQRKLFFKMPCFLYMNNNVRYPILSFFFIWKLPEMSDGIYSMKLTFKV